MKKPGDMCNNYTNSSCFLQAGRVDEHCQELWLTPKLSSFLFGLEEIRHAIVILRGKKFSGYGTSSAKNPEWIVFVGRKPICPENIVSGFVEVREE